MIVVDADVSLVERVAARFDALAPAGATCLVAVSGGPDSLALLDLLHLSAHLHRRPLIVAHVDHGIAPGSGNVAEAVRAVAESRGLAFKLRSLALGAPCSETRARTARHAALREMAQEENASVIVLAHHADDQAETVLMRVLRGSGPAGLAGMAARRGCWVRPLLDVRRDELAAHLATRSLVGWIDPANSDSKHLRSWLRSEVLPLLRSRLPDVVERLNRTARQAASARAAWTLVPEEMAGLELEQNGRGISVAAPVLQGYRSPLRHAVLAALGRQAGVLLGARRLGAIDRLLSSESGAGMIDLSGEVSAELAFGRLTFRKTGSMGADRTALSPGCAVQHGEVMCSVRVAPAIKAEREGWQVDVVPGPYLVRSWRAGDRIRPLGGSGARAVSVLLREARVSPARRKSWPVVVTGDDATIVWVPGICRSDAMLPAEGTEAWRVECAVS